LTINHRRFIIVSRIEKEEHTVTKQEFKALAKREFTDKEYEAIETVYTYHPSISETEGKKQIASLYDTFGIRIIADMMPTATKAKEYEERIAQKKHELEELQEEFKKFMHPLGA
jgi:predicted aldo/keto reductase-like oxidoreductase